jgi:hypothetical protein
MKCPCEECLKLSICKSTNRMICKDLNSYLLPVGIKTPFPYSGGKNNINLIYNMKNKRFANWISFVNPEKINFKFRLECVTDSFKERNIPTKVRLRYFSDFWIIEGFIIGFRAYRWIKERLKYDRIRDI